MTAYTSDYIKQSRSKLDFLDDNKNKAHWAPITMNNNNQRTLWCDIPQTNLSFIPKTTQEYVDPDPCHAVSTENEIEADHHAKNQKKRSLLL